MNKEARRSFRVSSLTVDQVNFALGMIADRMDELEGRRGSPEFKADVDLNSNRITNVGAASESDDAANLSQIPSIITAWPVGSVFISVVSTSPTSLLGFGTWVSIGAGKMLTGVDTSDSDFNAAEKTGGAKSVDLSHTHSTPAHTHPGGTIVQLGVGTTVNDGNGGDGTSGSGGSSTQSILNPYFTTYFWKRTA